MGIDTAPAGPRAWKPLTGAGAQLLASKWRALTRALPTAVRRTPLHRLQTGRKRRFYLSGASAHARGANLSALALRLAQNTQLGATLWYHDHAMGVTRLNVVMGLGGFYILRDVELEARLGLPTGEYDIGLAVQDRTLDKQGQILYPPKWTPHTFGGWSCSLQTVPSLLPVV